MSEKAEVLWLSQGDVIAAGGLDMAPIVDTVEEVFRLFGNGDYALPIKVSLQWEWDDPPPGEQRNHLNIMPGYVGGGFNAVGFKAISSFPR